MLRINKGYREIGKNVAKRKNEPKTSEILSRTKVDNAFEELRKIQNSLYNLRGEFEIWDYELDDLNKEELKGIILSEKIVNKAVNAEKVMVNLRESIEGYLKVIEEHERCKSGYDCDESNYGVSDEEKSSYGETENNYDDEDCEGDEDLADEDYDNWYDWYDSYGWLDEEEDDEDDEDDDENSCDVTDEVDYDDSLIEAIKVFREIYSRLEELEDCEDDGIGLVKFDRD